PLKRHNRLSLAGKQVWVLETSEPFDYSEGSEAEEYLRACFEAVDDLSVDSMQLQEKIRDWSSEYHLSPARANLVRPLRLDGMKNVLELGCGCGAITRYLGERQCMVEAVDGSRPRAELARQRCRELDNVHIVNANFNALNIPAQQYDAVFLIGVLEYAGMFMPGRAGARESLTAILEIVQKALKPGGILVIAIENRMGLKYWIGAGEDHFGEPDIGLYGYPADKGVRTYDKRQWEQIFSGGIWKHAFVYPFPDYKMPRVLINDDFLARDPYAYSLLQRISSTDHLSGWRAADDEFLRWKALHESGYLGEFANSFLIVASTEEAAVARAVPFDFVHFSSEGRKVHFRTVTEKRKTEELVRKKKIAASLQLPDGNGHVAQLTHDTRHLRGDLLTTVWLAACCRDDGGRSFAELLRAYREYLATSFKTAARRGDLVDLLPNNIIVTDSTPSYAVIDLEWSFSRDFDVDYVLFRALLWFGHHNRYLLSRFGGERGWRKVEDFVSDCFRSLDIPLQPRLKTCFSLEDQFHAEVAREGLSFSTGVLFYSPMGLQGPGEDLSGGGQEGSVPAVESAPSAFPEKLKRDVSLPGGGLNAVFKNIIGKLGGGAESQRRFVEQLGPVDHDFELLGLKTLQKGGCFPGNQRSEEPVILAYILMAIARLKAAEVYPVSFAELFCTDGYYTLFARKFGADRATGFDYDSDGHLARAMKISEYLGCGQVDFVKADMEKIESDRRFSIVANIGGLYHVSNPREVLARSYAMAERYLIIRNVVSLSTADENYFKAPAPGWTWGTRFSRQSFDRLVRDLDWKIIDQSFNELKGNPRPEDRGSVYYLIEKT
ncbi:MAG TPA: methyltransferase domain-containing protein, partial [Desulfobacteraceae bacterium]|nr:methyltransferase domain-containing protein [Desulfobacteraceae bacterium]